MKKKQWRYVVLAVAAVATVVLLVINALKSLKGFWQVNVSDGIEIFILLYVSFYLVQYQNKVDHKKEKIGELISKIQNRIMDPNLVKVDTDNDKKITMTKLTTISNLLEIVKINLDEPKNADLIISYMDNLSSTVMDHIDDVDYIEKSRAGITKNVSDIDTQLEKMKFEENL